jgi:arylsulfatase A-like enzyme
VDLTDMVPTFADFAGATLPKEHVFDGVSQKEVFLGTKQKSSREWIMAMGGKAGGATEKGLMNSYVFRDRVLRDERFKAYVGRDRSIEKLIDLKEDPWEEKNLKGNPEHKDIEERFASYVTTFPEQDNDPKHDKMKKLPYHRVPKKDKQKRTK